MPAALVGMAQPSHTLWITTRVLAAVVTVPITEELAYRGFLMRRIRDADFESVRFGDSGIWGLLVSSVVFGLGHGSMWLSGILVGILYGWLAMRTGRIGESIAAHAVTNALIALCVLSGQQWQLW
jgi:CAAX prenyl protease-like protein